MAHEENALSVPCDSFIRYWESRAAFIRKIQNMHGKVTTPHTFLPQFSSAHVLTSRWVSV